MSKKGGKCVLKKKELCQKKGIILLEKTGEMCQNKREGCKKGNHCIEKKREVCERKRCQRERDNRVKKRQTEKGEACKNRELC
jgi:hypothetical protein